MKPHTTAVLLSLVSVVVASAASLLTQSVSPETWSGWDRAHVLLPIFNLFTYFLFPRSFRADFRMSFLLVFCQASLLFGAFFWVFGSFREALTIFVVVPLSLLALYVLSPQDLRE
jgi:hypothetical protein